jgi:pyrroline-5-carboxylate reductase
MKIGIIGVGHLGVALATGYAKAGRASDVILSPRSAAKSASLHDQFGLKVAETNDDVVRASDALIISVRPADVIETVRMLPWRKDQVAISVAAGITAGSLRGAVIPADAARAMPVMASALNESAIPLFPSNELAIKALDPLGAVTAFDDEDSFNKTSALGAWFGWLFQLVGETTDALSSSGVDAIAARKVSADMMRAAGAFMAHDPDRDPIEVLRDLATPGGITEVGLRTLKDADAFSPWHKAMADSIHRLEELGRSKD